MKTTLSIAAGLLAGTATLMAAFPGGAVARVEDGTLTYQDFSTRNVSLPPGFKLELMYGVPQEQINGGWVSLCVDPKGRLYAASRNGRIHRLTLPPANSTEPVKVEVVDVAAGSSDGMLWAANSLYVMMEGRGLFRVTDSDGDDILDKTHAIRSIPYAGDHGTHTQVLGPDGRSLFVNAGNSTRLTDVDTSVVPWHYGEDSLLLRINTGFMDGSLWPGGWIAKTDLEGKQWQLYASGMRNQYDIAFNNVGELFVWDADMEWDMGDPWYRPTGVSHVISGADFGFHNGSGKLPMDYIDLAPRMINIGSGSPTGVTFGYGTKFPKKYQDALFINDNNGRIYTVHMTPDGSTYKAELERFLAPQPFAPADIYPNPVDGNLYLVTGGRGYSGFWRISYTGNESTAPSTPDLTLQSERDARHRLEGFHGRQDPAAVEALWPHLGSRDRAMRFAARTALEWQPVATWQERALAETDVRRSMAALVSLARVSANDEYFRSATDPAVDPALQGRILANLERISWNGIGYDDRYDLLRAYELAFIRLGRPNEATVQRLIAKFDPLFPAESREMNSILSEILVYLQSPNAAAKLVKAMREAPSAPHVPDALWFTPETQGTPLATLVKQKEQIHYALQLRLLRTGWTPALREEYLKYFIEFGANYSGGNTWAGSNTTIRNQAIQNLTDAERDALANVLNTPIATRGGRRGGGGGGGGGAGGPARAGGAPGVPPAGQ